MTSSTEPSEPIPLRRPALILAVVACAGAAFGAGHGVFDSLARSLERQPDTYLWSREEPLQLLNETNYVGRGAGRILLCGPSEAREDFVEPVIREHLNGWTTYQNAMGWGTLADLLLLLGYIERAYGPTAVPEALVVGVTPRFLAKSPDGPSRFQTLLERYSPLFAPDLDGDLPEPRRKDLLESSQGWLRFLLHQRERYRRALWGLAAGASVRLLPALEGHPFTWLWRSPHKYFHLPSWTPDAKRRAFRRGYYEDVYAWDAEQDREKLRAHFAALRGFASRHGVKLFFVHMPEISVSRARHDPLRYARYEELLREGTAGLPFLDLREMLEDQEFYDHCHATAEAAAKVSGKVGEFLASRLKEPPDPSRRLGG